MTAVIPAPGRVDTVPGDVRRLGPPARVALLAAAATAVGVRAPSTSRDEGATAEPRRRQPGCR